MEREGIEPLADRDPGDETTARCPYCGTTPYATWWENNYGVAPGVAMEYKMDLGKLFAQCIFGHRWVMRASS